MDAVGGRPVVVVVGDGRPLGAGVRAAGGRRASCSSSRGRRRRDPVRLVDAGTGSAWSFAGEAVSGPLAGKRLPRVYVLKDYWFDWKAYNPKTKVYALQSR